jgi:histidine triad (HIT) family protein
MTDCLFCGIANKTVDALILWEDSDIVAFLDRWPIREGHCQIIPKQHVETFEQMAPDLAAKVLELAQRLARRMKDIYNVDRVAFLFTGGDLPHVHAHVLPMHEKTDITSARYILNSEPIRFGSSHLEADQESLLRVKSELEFG